MGGPISKDEEQRRRDALEAGRAQGLTASGIARQLGIPPGTYSYWMSKRGYRMGGSRDPLGDKRAVWEKHGAMIVELRSRGETWKRIGPQVGLTAKATARLVGRFAPDVIAAEAEARSTKAVTAGEIATAARSRRERLALHAGVFRGQSGWELHCDRCGRTPVRVYPSKARAEKARALHDRCCEGVDTTIRGRAA